jgi:hypothetical protein
MYDLAGIKRALREPARAVTEINRLITRRGTRYTYNPEGVDVFDEDWDVLILLDACRYDAFEKHADLPGTLESRISRGSSSVEFIHGNFANRTLHDVVYVSANDWYAKLHDSINAEVHAHEYVDLEPEVVTNAALDCADRYPNKRLLVHYMQPHFPYLDPKWEGVFVPDGDLLTTYRESGVTREQMWDAYVDNLRLVLDEVRTLFDELTGKIVVSADHGELFGDQEAPIPIRRYGHPRGIYVEELVKVPWLVYEAGPRREIIADPPEKQVSYDEDEVNERLRDLGYAV